MRHKIIVIFILLLFSGTAMANIRIVAAENVYGELAAQIGGQYVQVVSILNNPNQDPHLFSVDIKTAKAIATADMVIYNGIHYDPWMESLIESRANPPKSIMIIAALMHKKAGDNPHLWYDPNTMLVYADNLTQHLINLDAQHESYYQQHLEVFKQCYQPLLSQIAHIKERYQGISVIATEPVFGYMSDALGLSMQASDFQLNIMNNTAPSAKAVKDFEDKLRLHQVKALIYNNQVSDPVTQRMQRLAQQAGIPVIGVSEMQPADQDYITWMQTQLSLLDKALSS